MSNLRQQIQTREIHPDIVPVAVFGVIAVYIGGTWKAQSLFDDRDAEETLARLESAATAIRGQLEQQKERQHGSDHRKEQSQPDTDARESDLATAE